MCITKNKFMKKIKLSLPVLLFSLSSFSVSGQTFINPASWFYNYGVINGQRPEMTACYSQRDINTAQFGLTDLYVGSWSTNFPGGTASEVTYRFTVPGTPSATITTGRILYKNPVADLEVGMVFDKNYGENVLLVAYYEFGTGHQLDIYRINGAPANPFTKVANIPLSNSSSYGRIRMDSHLGYGIGIVWENPGVGIEVIACDNGNWSGKAQLTGTLDELGPDIAFSHGNVALNLNFVYKNNNNNNITKSVIQWATVMGIPFGTTSPLTPLVQDVNTAPGNISNITIDCPDHYSNENWAYTYTDGHSVFVRFINYFGAAMATTKVINPHLVSAWMAKTPTIHYGDGAISGQSGRVMVGWYSPYIGGDSHYLAKEFDEELNPINTQPQDYYRLNIESWTFSRSGIAFSKMSDVSMVPAFLYATYITETGNNSGTFNLNHRFHDFNTLTAFRGNTPSKTAYEECRKHNGQPVIRAIQSTVYPNPFSNSFNNSFSLKESSTITLKIVDIKGTVLKEHTEKRPSGTHIIKMEDIGSLPTGAYLLHTIVNGNLTSTQTIIKK